MFLLGGGSGSHGFVRLSSPFRSVHHSLSCLHPGAIRVGADASGGGGMNAAARLTPVAANERIETLDILRGFAVFEPSVEVG